MKVKQIEKLLKQALLQNGTMEYALYEHELEEVIDDLKLSMQRDKDDYIFTVTENRGHVSMAMVNKSGEIYINEVARDRLKSLWLKEYENNMRIFIPDFAQQLAKDELPIHGVKTVDQNSLC